MNNGSSEIKKQSLCIALPHFLLASISLLAISIMLFFSKGSIHSHYFQPTLLSITHIAILGFITSILFGSVYHFHYVLFQVNIYNELLGKISFIALLTGIILLCKSFYQFSVGIICQLGAIITFLSFVLFSINMFIAIKKTKLVTIETEIIFSSLIWLLSTGLLGVLLVFNFTYAFIPKSHLQLLIIHSHLGFGGWIILLIIGTTSRLITLNFTNHEKKERNSIKISYILINSGLIFFVISIFWQLPTISKIASSIIITAGILFFMFYLISIYLHKKGKDYFQNFKYKTGVIIFLLCSIIFGILLSTEILSEKANITLSIIYGVTFILGFCGTLLLELTLKIIPILISRNSDQNNFFIIKTQLPIEKKIVGSSSEIIYFFFIGIFILCISFTFKSNIGMKIASMFLIFFTLEINYEILKYLLVEIENNIKVKKIRKEKLQNIKI